jgi:hypothetical protein
LDGEARDYKKKQKSKYAQSGWHVDLR